MSRNAIHQYTFEIDTTPGSTPTLVEICGIESVDLPISYEVQNGFFTCDNGWGYSDRTGAQITGTLEGKRVLGDAGQEYVIGLQYDLTQDAKTTIKITYPLSDTGSTAATLEIPATITNIQDIGGATTELSVFSMEFMSDGEPTYTPEA